MARYKLRRRSSNYIDNRKQKNRFTKNVKLKELDNVINLAFLFLQNGLLEFRHFIYIKRFIKKICVKQKKKMIRKMRMRLKKKKNPYQQPQFYLN